MFYYNTNLKTIYASDMFNTNVVTSSTNMFYNTTNLVGGAGTTYNRSYVDKTYARIDGGTSNPGYFTDIADKPKEPESFATDSWKTIINAVKNNNKSTPSKNGLSALRNALDSNSSGIDIAKAVYQIAQS